MHKPRDPCMFVDRSMTGCAKGGGVTQDTSGKAGKIWPSSMELALTAACMAGHGASLSKSTSGDWRNIMPNSMQSTHSHTHNRAAFSRKQSSFDQVEIQVPTSDKGKVYSSMLPSITMYV